MKIISENLSAAIIEFSNHETRSLWALGDLGVLAFEQFMKDKEENAGDEFWDNQHIFHFWDEFANKAGKNPRRCERITNVSEAYEPVIREEYGELPFGFFEDALKFSDTDDRINFLAYVIDQTREKGERPSKALAMKLYNTHILGKVTSEKDAALGADVPEITPDMVDMAMRDMLFFAQDGTYTYIIKAIDLIEAKEKLSDAGYDPSWGLELDEITFDMNGVWFSGS